MQRNPARLTADTYDVVVVGGGVYGACAAWEAALSGLKVAMIEAADFGNATSSNSLRTLHGGLRHLQRLNIARMRESVRARREWLQLAPHLARPMRFVLPTFGHGVRGPEAMRVALSINDLVSFDRNQNVRPNRTLPPSAVWSGRLARAILTGTRTPGCNGAATWFDAVCLNTERLLLAVVSASVSAGAQVANYVRATGLEMRDGSVSAVRARDELTGEEFEIRARSVIDATGPQVGEWTGIRLSPERLFHASKAFNLLTRPLPFKEGMGFSVPQLSRGTSDPRTYFLIPWNGRALVGTRHLRCEHSSRSAGVTRQDVADFLDDLNRVLGRNRIGGSDVLGVYAGLLPEKSGNSGDDVELTRAPEIIDHGRDGMQGVFSVIGVKWTTSRLVAERVVRTACQYLRKPARLAGPPPPLWGAGAASGVADGGASRGEGGGASAGSVGAGAVNSSGTHRRWRLDPEALAHLEEMYGPARDAFFSLLDQDEALTERLVPDLPVIKGQIVHAVREEMAVQLADIVMRRTPLYMSEALDSSALNACAAAVARELRWGKRETAAQIDRVELLLQAFRGPFHRQPALPAVTEWEPQRVSLS